MDIILSAAGLFLFLPAFLIIAILIKMDTRGPVFFIHQRVGRNFKPFSLYKFRTMIDKAQELGQQITSGSDSCITRFGKLLRKMKLDELPQLWNVLKGNMSFVGPRPEISKYIEMFRDEYREILKVKPGITDFAAIEFRDEENVLKRFKNPENGYIKEVLPIKINLYKKYLRERGLLTDMKLIMLTLWKIVK
ncbi:MAG: sugar transferase [Thermodesulfovibrionales bacterium]|nr:sugar transferase [Thermodesulfovibrionales bacterium]